VDVDVHVLVDVDVDGSLPLVMNQNKFIVGILNTLQCNCPLFFLACSLRQE
jgi:hypothetical protein